MMDSPDSSLRAIPGDPGSRRHRRSRRRAPRRLLLFLFLVVAALGLTTAVALYFVSFPEVVDPWTVAEEFVGWLKVGEELAPGSVEEPRIGYARAYDLLSSTMRERLPWEAFCQGFLLYTHPHGQIMAGEPLHKRGRDLHGLRLFYFRLVLGHPHQVMDEMTVLTLRVAVGREEGRWVVAAFDLTPVDTVKAQ